MRRDSQPDNCKAHFKVFKASFCSVEFSSPWKGESTVVSAPPTSHELQGSQWPSFWEFQLFVLFCFRMGGRGSTGVYSQEDKGTEVTDGHRESWQIYSQYCLSREASVWKEVSAATWSLILQDFASEVEAGARAKRLSGLIGNITPDTREAGS